MSLVRMRLVTPVFQVLLCALALALVPACGDDGDDAGGDSDSSNTDSAGGDTDSGGGDDTAALEPIIPDGCNPLAFEHDCTLPFPSDFFRVPNGDTHVIRLTPAARVQGRRDTESWDLYDELSRDGFSTHQPLLAWLGTEVDTVASGLPFHTDGGDPSLGQDSPLLLIHADTGERVPVWAELDATREAIRDSRRTLQIRPFVRLENGARYIVALRNLIDSTGNPVASPAGFEALRRGVDPAHPVLGHEAERWDHEVWPVLEQAGVAPDDLTLAWDFTTQSFASVAGDLIAIRQDLAARLDATPPEVTVTRLEEEDIGGVPDDVDLALRLVGTLAVPLYLEEDTTMASLRRDAAGRPAAEGTTTAAFTLYLPQSVVDAWDEQGPAGIIMFGHGFFGSRSEMSGHPVQLASRYGYVLVGIDWAGMSNPDVGVVFSVLLNTLDGVFGFTRRLHQGMANQLALEHAILTTLADVEALQAPDGNPWWDPDRIAFYGISQGHILGGTYVALSRHTRRAVLTMGGASFSFMMSRATPFQAFLAPMRRLISDPVELQKVISMAGSALDPIDPLTWAPWVRTGYFDDGPQTREVLLQVGMGDTAVPPLAAHLHARALGAPLLAPAPRAIWGLETAESGAASALTEFDLGITPKPDLESRFPDRTNEVHDGLRHLPEPQTQIDAFLRDGTVVHPCGDVPCLLELP